MVANGGRTQTADPRASAIVERITRDQWPQIVAQLCGIFGFEKRDLVEDALQESLIKALHKWSASSIPDNPTAWLITVAKRHILDVLKRDRTFQSKERQIVEFLDRDYDETEFPFDSTVESLMNDPSLQSLFACCHPRLSSDSQMCLALRFFCRYTASDIATALHINHAATAKRLSRALQTLKSGAEDAGIHTAEDIGKRLTAALSALAVIFEQGLYPIKGSELIHIDYCQEAMFHTIHLLRHPLTNRPETQALIAWMLLESAQIPAMQTDNGIMTPFARRKRATWNAQMVHKGLQYFLLSSQARSHNELHARAALAACLCMAPVDNEVNWQRALTLSGSMIERFPRLHYMLDRLEFLIAANCAELALSEARQLEPEVRDHSHPRLSFVLAEAYAAAGLMFQAEEHYRQTLRFTQIAAIEKYILQQLDTGLTQL